MPEQQKNKASTQQHEYIYFKDHEGKLKRHRKLNYQPRPGYIRFKFIQPYYFWWRRTSFDFKNATLPLLLGFTAAFIIYQMSMMWSQNDLERQIKARLPFDFSYSLMKQAEKGDFQTKDTLINKSL